MQKPIQHTTKSLRSVAAVASATTTCLDLDSIYISGISQTSNEILAGDLFIALPGENFHGAQFAADAVARGAVALLTDLAGSKLITDDVPLLISTNPRRSAGILSAWFYSEPMRDLYSVGVTGTNGKTTVTTLLYQIMTSAGRSTGLIGTVETRIGAEIIESRRTTPESTDLQALSAVMRERGLRNLVMEVSSHAITLDRVRGSHFAVVAFTNLSQDHLDFHKTMESYFQAKAALFTFEYADLAVINIDDAYGRKLAELTELPVVSVSRNNSDAIWYYTKIEKSYSGANIAIRGSNGIFIESKTELHGGYNFDNLLLAIAIAVESGIDPLDVASLIPHLTGASGRLEPVRFGQNFTALVDYAHSPDAVTRVLETAREITAGIVIAVLGCGGDRDRSKRPLMGAALQSGSDIAIFSSDNPRSEAPEAILREMTSGLTITRPSEIIVDRGQAISLAVSHAQAGDLVIVLGKGHEKGQEINGEVHEFDDRIELARAIEAKRTP